MKPIEINIIDENIDSGEDVKNQAKG